MGIISEMLVCGDITVTSCTKLTCHYAVHQIGTVWHGNSYYKYSCTYQVPSAASCRTICGVK